MKEKFEAIKDVLEELDDETIVKVWNAYCEKNSSDDMEIHTNDESTIDDLLGGKSPFDVITSIKEYNASHDYFVYGVYGIESFSNLEDHIFYGDLARAIERDYTILTENADEDDWAQDIELAIIEYGKSKGINTDDWSAPFNNEDMISEDWDELLEDE